MNTDNDIFVFLRDNKTSNAFGFTSQGRLSAVVKKDGTLLHFYQVLQLK